MITKAKDIYKIFINNIKNFILWIKIPKNAIKFAISSVILLTITILIVRFLFGKIIMFGLAIAGVYYMFKKIEILLPNFENPTVCWTILNFIFGVFESLNDVLGKYCSKFNVVDDIYDKTSCIGTLYNAPIFRLKLLLINHEITTEDCNFIKNAIQGRVNARIQNIAGYFWAVPKLCEIPLIKIAEVEKEGIYLIISVLLTNNETSVNAAYESDNPKLPPSSDDTDTIF